MAKAANQSLMVIVLSLALAGVFVTSGVSIYRTLTSKATEQEEVTESVVRWKRSYMALAGTQERWKKTYPVGSKATIPDEVKLVKLLNLTGLGLSADTDKLVLKSDDRIKANNVDLGLTKACLGTGQNNFLVEAATYDELLNGIERLARRQDLFVDNVTILGDKDVPQARIGDLCVLIRDI